VKASTGGFRRVVQAVARRAQSQRSAGERDDASTAADAAGRLAQGVERAPKVDLDVVAEILIARFSQRDRPDHPRRGHDNVDATQLRLRTVEQGANLVGVTNVSADRDRCPTRLPDRLRRPVRRIGRGRTGDRYCDALPGEFLRNSTTNAPRGSGDDRSPSPRHHNASGPPRVFSRLLG